MVQQAEPLRFSSAYVLDVALLYNGGLEVAREIVEGHPRGTSSSPRSDIRVDVGSRGKFRRAVLLPRGGPRQHV